jgi:hypothetical protein
MTMTFASALHQYRRLASSSLTSFRCNTPVRTPTSTAIIGNSSIRRFAAGAISCIDREAVADLFVTYAKDRDGEVSLDWHDVRDLLEGIGESPNEENVRKLFHVADVDGNGFIDMDEYVRRE